MKTYNILTKYLLFFVVFTYFINADVSLNKCNKLDKSDIKLINDCKRLKDLNIIAQALYSSFKIHLNYTQPETIFIDKSINKKNWNKRSDLLKLVQEGFLKKLPLDPINDNNYYYFYEPLDNLFIPAFQLCAKKLETTGQPYCLKYNKYYFYSDHVFVKADILFKNKTIRVISGNILYGGGNPISPQEVSTLKEQANILNKFHPNILTLQEVEVNTARVLSRDAKIYNDKNEIIFFKNILKLKYDYYTIFKKFLIGSSGKLILSNYKIIFRKKINRHLSIIGVDINNNAKVDLIVGNVHIKPKGINLSRKRIIDNMVEKLISKYPNTPIILSGDFFYNNLNLEKFGFIDTYKICGYQNEFGMKYKSTFVSKKNRRLDYIFIKDLQCKKNSNNIMLPHLNK